jgi:hypothetical protein
MRRTMTGHGGQRHTLFSVPATSNARAEPIFPRTSFEDLRFGFFGLNIRYGTPTITVEKEDYGTGILEVGHWLTILRDVTRWDYRQSVTIVTSQTSDQWWLQFRRNRL